MRTITEMIAAVHDSTAASWNAFAACLAGIALVAFVCSSLPG